MDGIKISLLLMGYTESIQNKSRGGILKLCLYGIPSQDKAIHSGVAMEIFDELHFREGPEKFCNVVVVVARSYKVVVSAQGLNILNRQKSLV